MSEQSVTVNINATRKSMGVAYALWFFLGGLGLHRFYLEKAGTGVAQFILFVFGWLFTPLLAVWLIWWLVDIYFIYRYASESNSLDQSEKHSSFTINQSPKGSDLDELEKLHALKEKGVINEEEYSQRKEKILAGI